MTSLCVHTSNLLYKNLLALGIADLKLLYACGVHSSDMSGIEKSSGLASPNVSWYSGGRAASGTL